MVLDSNEAAAHPGDSIFMGDSVVGVVTSAAYGHRTRENLAMGFVDVRHADKDTELDVLLLGHYVKCRIVDLCRYDPENRLVKG